MTNKEREFLTLSFSDQGLDCGAKQEIFEPWDLTIADWEKEGLVTDFNKKLQVPTVPTEVGYIKKDSPVDVNTGVDIVAVRKRFPSVKFIGGFNKLEILKGYEAIDNEFKRLEPVIRQGGYLCGIDHQAAPGTPYEYYQYYMKRLGKVMAECRGK